MTTPFERLRSLVQASDFLNAVMDRACLVQLGETDIPLDVVLRTSDVLRCYPSLREVHEAATDYRLATNAWLSIPLDMRGTDKPRWKDMSSGSRTERRFCGLLEATVLLGDIHRRPSNGRWGLPPVTDELRERACAVLRHMPSTAEITDAASHPTAMLVWISTDYSPEKSKPAWLVRLETLPPEPAHTFSHICESD